MESLLKKFWYKASNNFVLTTATSSSDINKLDKYVTDRFLLHSLGRTFWMGAHFTFNNIIKKTKVK